MKLKKFNLVIGVVVGLMSSTSFCSLSEEISQYPEVAAATANLCSVIDNCISYDFEPRNGATCDDSSGNKSLSLLKIAIDKSNLPRETVDTLKCYQDQEVNENPGSMDTAFRNQANEYLKKVLNEPTGWNSIRTK